MRITRSIMLDPSKYLTLGFIKYLIKRLLDSGKDSEVQKILLDPRISVSLYPGDLWSLYIEIKCKEGNQ